MDKKTGCGFSELAALKFRWPSQKKVSFETIDNNKTEWRVEKIDYLSNFIDFSPSLSLRSTPDGRNGRKKIRNGRKEQRELELEQDHNLSAATI